MHVDEIVQGVYKRTQKTQNSFGNVKGRVKSRPEDTEDSHDGEVSKKSSVTTNPGRKGFRKKGLNTKYQQHQRSERKKEHVS